MPGLFSRMRGWLARLRGKTLAGITPPTGNEAAEAADERVIADIAKAIAAAEEIVIFSGAGMSAESGIPTFQDGSTGLWNNVDPGRVASTQGFVEDPEHVWEWHVEMRRLIDRCEPNAGHHAIAALERRMFGKRFTVITQNIDGYHQLAGNSRVFELHGSIRRVRCHRNCSYIDLWQSPDHHPTTCPQCGAQVRPDIVLFGEPLNEDLFNYSEVAALNADVLITVGTSAYVRPAGDLPLMAKASGAMVVEINPHQTSFSPQATYSIRTTATAFFNRLLQHVGR